MIKLKEELSRYDYFLTNKETEIRVREINKPTEITKICFVFPELFFKNNFIVSEEYTDKKFEKEDLNLFNYACLNSGILDIKNYTLDEDCQNSILKEDVRNNINNALVVITEREDDSIENYKKINQAIGKDENHILFQKKIIDPNFANITTHDYSDHYDDDEDFSYEVISQVNIEINHSLNISDFLEIPNHKIADDLNKVLSPVFGVLGLYDPDSYSHETREGYSGDEIIGFYTGDKEMNALEKIANKVILEPDLSKRKEIVSNFVSEWMNKNNVEIFYQIEPKKTRLSHKI